MRAPRSRGRQRMAPLEDIRRSTRIDLERLFGQRSNGRAGESHRDLAGGGRRRFSKQIARQYAYLAAVQAQDSAIRVLEA